MTTAPVRTSVAMCTYNGAAYLPALLDSIVTQTAYPAELIVTDDRSTDGTIAILRCFEKEAPFPVSIRMNEQRLGPSKNFGRCIASCSEEIIILTDQDDVWTSNRVAETQHAYSDADVTFTFSDAPLIDSGGNPLGRSIFETVPIRPADRARLEQGTSLLPLILRYGVLYGTTMSVRREIARLALPIPDGWSHDEWISLIGSALGQSRRTEPVTRYRQHEAQVVGAGQAGLKAMIAAAAQRPENAYAVERGRYETGARALQPQASTDALLSAIQGKISFLRARETVHGGGVKGLTTLFKQLGKGGYGDYAAGPRSILKDVGQMLKASARKLAAPAVKSAG